MCKEKKTALNLKVRNSVRTINAFMGRLTCELSSGVFSELMVDDMVLDRIKSSPGPVVDSAPPRVYAGLLLEVAIRQKINSINRIIQERMDACRYRVEARVSAAFKIT